MRSVEKLVGNLDEFLKRRYSAKEMSPAEIALEVSSISGGKIEIVHNTILNWLHKFGYPIRMSNEYWYIPAHRRKRIKAIRKNWQDPKKRERYLKGLRTPEARRHKSKASKRAWKEKRKIMLAGHKGGRETLKKSTRRRVEEKLFQLVTDPQVKTTHERLLLLLTKEGSRDRVAEKVMVSVSTLKILEKEEKIKFKPQQGPRINLENFNLVKLARQRGLLKNLTLRQKEIIELRYGEIPLSQSKIAKRLGCTNRNASQVEKWALDRLRQELRRKR